MLCSLNNLGVIESSAEKNPMAGNSESRSQSTSLGSPFDVVFG